MIATFALAISLVGQSISPSIPIQSARDLATKCYAKGRAIGGWLWVLEDKKESDLHRYVTITKDSLTVNFIYERWTPDAEKVTYRIDQTAIYVNGDGMMTSDACKTIVEKSDGEVVSTVDVKCDNGSVQTILNEMVSYFGGED